MYGSILNHKCDLNIINVEDHQKRLRGASCKSVNISVSKVETFSCTININVDADLVFPTTPRVGLEQMFDFTINLLSRRLSCGEGEGMCCVWIVKTDFF